MKFNFLSIFLSFYYLNFISSIFETRQKENRGDTIYFISKSPIQNISNLNYELNDYIVKKFLKVMKSDAIKAVQYKIKLVPK